jgi:hypothetical protein
MCVPVGTRRPSEDLEQLVNARRRRGLVAALEPMLGPGERIEATALVNLSTVSFKKNLAIGVAAAILSGGMMTAAATPKPMYAAVTTQRLFIFEADELFSKPKSLVAVFPLSAVRRTEIKSSLVRQSFIVIDEQQQSALRLIFPRFTNRKDVGPVASRIAVASA